MSINLYWAVELQKLVPSLYSDSAVNLYAFYLRDTLPVTLRVVTASNLETPRWTVNAIEAGTSIKFGAKALATYPTDETFLFAAATWVEAGSGTSTTYSADISLNTAELIAAIGAETYLDCRAELTLQNTGGEHLSTTQTTFRIYRDVIVGTEGMPASQYAMIVQYLDGNGVQCVRLVNADGGAVAVFKRGSPYIYCAETGLWYPATVTIQDNVPVLGLGDGEAM